MDSSTASDRSALPHRIVRAAVMGVLALVLVGVPTDIIDTPLFGRDVPVRWWEYPVLAATTGLTAAWFAIPGPARSDRVRDTPFGAVMLSLFAVGCPVCNKLILVALGTSGALSFWQPIQPIVALFSVGLLSFAVRQRWRRRDCTDSTCTSPAAGSKA